MKSSLFSWGTPVSSSMVLVSLSEGQVSWPTFREELGHEAAPGAQTSLVLARIQLCPRGPTSTRGSELVALVLSVFQGGSGRARWWVKPRVTQETQPEFWGWEHLECHWGRHWNSCLLLIQILGLCAETANSGHLPLRPQAPFTCCWSLNSKLGW